VQVVGHLPGIERLEEGLDDMAEGDNQVEQFVDGACCKSGLWTLVGFLSLVAVKGDLKLSS